MSLFDEQDLCEDCLHNNVESHFANYCWYCSNGNCFDLKKCENKSYNEHLTTMGFPSCLNFKPLNDTNQEFCCNCRYFSIGCSVKEDIVLKKQQEHFSDIDWYYN